MRSITVIVALALISGAARCWSQASPDLNTYFKDYIGLSDGQVREIRSGKAVAKNLRSRTSAEIFVFGAVYINATPDAYIALSTDFDRLRKLPGYLALGRFSDPPQLADLGGFTFERDDIKSLKKCKPGDCDVQMPESSMQNLRQLVDWSAPGVAEQVNELLQETALKRLRAYQRDGNVALGIYNDKEHPTDVAGQFRYLLSYSKALPEYLPALHSYLLSYPRGKPANVDDTFYWSKVKFGLKPTLRMVHVITMRGNGDEPAYAVAEKQLYASHYFQTALDLTFCVADKSRLRQPGFYLIKIMGSEQAGLTGFKGSIIRHKAVDRSASNLRKYLAAAKNALENGR
ncbi:MAG TPA: hypothetical protein VLT16_02260 [Candidatus Limnocylindrales bacterium]|nr:hypothetical protein [Candidatus Limnocylindrales bacterium]